MRHGTPLSSTIRAGEGFGEARTSKKRANGDLRGVWLSNKNHRSSIDLDALQARKYNVDLKECIAASQAPWRTSVVVD